MYRVIVFIFLVIVIAVLMTRPCGGTLPKEEPNEIVEIKVTKPKCSSCAFKKKYDPSGSSVAPIAQFPQELDPNKPTRLKLESPNGQISTFLTKKEDHTNLYVRPIDDFFPMEGRPVFAPGTKATWGLANPFDQAPVRSCGRVTVPVNNNSGQCDNGIVHQLAQLYYGKWFK